MVDTVGVLMKFSKAGMSSVGRGVLCKSTTRLTHFPALHADPWATRGGGHSEEMERMRGRGRERREGDTENLGITTRE